MNMSKVPPWSLYSSGTGPQTVEIPPVQHEENHGFTAENVRKLAIELMNDPELGTRSRVVNPFQHQEVKQAPAPQGAAALPDPPEQPHSKPNVIIMST